MHYAVFFHNAYVFFPSPPLLYFAPLVTTPAASLPATTRVATLSQRRTASSSSSPQATQHSRERTASSRAATSSSPSSSRPLRQRTLHRPLAPTHSLLPASTASRVDHPVTASLVSTVSHTDYACRAWVRMMHAISLKV